MNRPRKNLNTILLMASAILAVSVAFYSCSKDNTATADSYQLEGTWQLYQTTTGVTTDSIYAPSEDNEIIFTPKYFWRYSNGAVSDSGFYNLTNGALTEASFTAQITYNTLDYSYLTIKGDTLYLSGHGVIMDEAIYIKSSANTSKP